MTDALRANLEALHKRIRGCGVNPETLRIVAVTKTFGPEAVRAAARAGLGAVGENYANELRNKRRVVGDVDVAWYYLGALQTNKIAQLCRDADVLAGVCRSREITAIARAREAMAVYVQVDYTTKASRNGVAPGGEDQLVREAQDAGLDVRGLMTVAPPDPRLASDAFAALRASVDRLGLVECSMGMSDDLELALRAGSTEIRVGRSLFGPRAVTKGVNAP